MSTRRTLMSEIIQRQLHIEGMSCGHCTGRVQKALSTLEGVQEARVDLASGTATVIGNAAVTDAVLRAAVEDAGYDVTDIKQ